MGRLFPDMADQIGTLKVGAWGDAVVFEQQRGQFALHDSRGEVRMGTQRLQPMLVVRAGSVYEANH